MAQEDEMSLPYLVFRTWRNYFDELLKAYELVVDEEYQRARRQIHKAKKNLLESKELLLQRGMSPDDSWISDVNDMLVDTQEFVQSLARGEYKFLREYMDESLCVSEIYREWAAEKL